MGLSRAEASTQIAASPDACFAALTDYESFPRWQSAVKHVQVRERDAEGRGLVVAFRIDARLTELGYTLRYAYCEPQEIGWELEHSDDLDDVRGSYRLQDTDVGTLATYELAIDAGRWIPGKVVELLRERVMQRSVAELRRHVEALQGGSSARRPAR